MDYIWILIWIKPLNIHIWDPYQYPNHLLNDPHKIPHVSPVEQVLHTFFILSSRKAFPDLISP